MYLYPCLRHNSSYPCLRACPPHHAPLTPLNDVGNVIWKGYKVKYIILYYAFNNFTTSSALSRFMSIYVVPCIYMASLAHFSDCFLLFPITRTGRQIREHAVFSAILFLWSEKWKKTFTWSKELEIVLVFLLKALRPWTR